MCVRSMCGDPNESVYMMIDCIYLPQKCDSHGVCVSVRAISLSLSVCMDWNAVYPRPAGLVKPVKNPVGKNEEECQLRSPSRNTSASFLHTLLLITTFQSPTQTSSLPPKIPPRPHASINGF